MRLPAVVASTGGSGIQPVFGEFALACHRTSFVARFQSLVEFGEEIDDLAGREFVARVAHAVTKSRAGTKMLARAK
jgi:hypothetical protein